MKLNRDNPQGVALVDAYDDASFTVRGEVFRGSVLVSPAEGGAEWPVTAFAALDAEAFSTVVDRRPAVLLIGTGPRQRFPRPAALRTLIEAGIGYEVMDNGSACRTYNLLAAEGRDVVVALLREVA